MKMKKNSEIDMLHGPLARKILFFSLPLMLSGILQLLFNAVDVMVVGKWAGHQALAAVGSNGSLINMMTAIFMGLSIGSSVQVSNHYGANRPEEVSKVVHTSIVLSLISGILLMIIGLTFARPLLSMMGSPEDVIDLATIYLRIYFLGMPAMLLYNFGNAILRAVGDTKRPLYYLATAGVINVLLNLLFVIGFGLGVVGVAVATIIAQSISAFLILRCLMKEESAIQLQFGKLKIHRDKLIKIIQIGVPAGLQGIVFSFSNVLVQSSVNSFGSIAISGNTAAANIEGFVYTAMNSFYQACITFTSQNLGGGKYSRINKILWNCIILVVITGNILSFSLLFLSEKALGLYSSDPAVISYGVHRLKVILSYYFLCGVMEIFVGSLRGLGYSMMPMIVSTFGSCIFRIVWIYTYFAWYRSLDNLYLAYPLSWLLTSAIHLICFLVVRKKFPKEDLAPALRGMA